MKISIKETTQEEIKSFHKKHWRKLDIEHYGRPIRWVEKEFIFKATQKGQIIGTIKMNFEGGVVHLRSLIVVEDRRRQGIGRKLIEKVEEVGKQLGAHKIILFTGKGWKANRFYKKLGFKKTANLPKHYQKCDFVIYSKMI